jgi:hypothetical protein
MLISGLMDIAANNSKDVGDINIAIDLKSVLVNLPDSEDVVEIGDADRKNIEKAIELSVGKRPPVWFQCVSMWKQFQEWPKRTEVKTKSK